MDEQTPPSIRLIVVEDSSLDYELLLAHLRDEPGLGAIDACRVEDEPNLRAALADAPCDAVITDHNLPNFDSFSALATARSSDADLPVLVVSGEMSDALAVDAMHAGADDFVLKTNILRIGPALVRALRAAAGRRERRTQALRLRELTTHLQQAKEDERRAIARELHDDLGTALTALKFEVVRLQHQMWGRPALSESLTVITELVTQAVAVSHRIQHNLRPPVLDAGLPAALDWLVRNLAAGAQFSASFESNRDELALDAYRAEALYRVAQESLNNVARHARAQHVSVTLFVTDTDVTLEVADDGVGFNAKELASTPGFGLRGLIERARSLGGWVEIDSQPGRGATVMVSVPVDSAQAPRAQLILEESR
jgi:two-component system, NarL family, sensor histidine kinase UhpB